MTPKNKKKIRKELTNNRPGKKTSQTSHEGRGARDPKKKYDDDTHYQKKNFSDNRNSYDRNDHRSDKRNSYSDRNKNTGSRRDHNDRERDTERRDGYEQRGSGQHRNEHTGRYENRNDRGRYERRDDRRDSYEKRDSRDDRSEKRPYVKKNYNSDDRRDDRTDNRNSGHTDNRRYETKQRGHYDERSEDKRDHGYQKKNNYNREERNNDRDSLRNSEDRRSYKSDSGEQQFKNDFTNKREYKPRINFEEDRSKRFIDEESPLKKPRKQFEEKKYSVYENNNTKERKIHKPKLEEMRLNKYLAHCGVAARRKADEFIAGGLVTVNGTVVKEMGYKVKLNDEVRYKGKLISPANHVYILLNKPKDFITTADDEKGRKTVMELIGDATSERVYPVGRLDRNTTGLLLLTNDGELAQKLSHPSHGARKVYSVELNKPLTPQHLQQITEGVKLEDGIAMVDEIAFAHPRDKHIIGVMLHVGKNRIVRRIFESLGYEVEKLDRTFYAGLDKRGLDRGKWRFLTEKEVTLLKRF